MPQADHDHEAQVAAFGRCVTCTGAQMAPPAKSAHEARDGALGRVEGAAPPTWLRDARAAIEELARYGHDFTSDDVWARLRTPPEPRALGAVMRQAAADGIIVGTGQTQPSVRRDCHARPVAIWRGSPQVRPQPVQEPML